MTADALNNAKSALAAMNGVAKVIAMIVALVIAWTTLSANVSLHDDRITRVETELKQFKADVKDELRAMNAHVHEIAVGVATLVERTKDKPDKP